MDFLSTYCPASTNFKQLALKPNALSIMSQINGHYVIQGTSKKP